ncbi:hypothetical protein COK52_25095 [Bacillus thuringiensis]|uniref:DUF6572 domain-containing protein n=1 Tax=Bacillus cereus group TaxID=86661 RepID=UPI000BF7EE2B|nr:DUF6572 domain-containing protein [Bacillus albus]PEY26269.1 hypothetical protein CN340_15480 [Bacillus anthracis]PFT18144.1 hypothetical protein COK52_25095 [Bacillus thuringiensis]
MGLRELDEIDFMGYDKDEKIAYLIITDEEDWKDEDGHISLLIEKIHTCMAFVESGEVFERYPETKEYNFVIRIYAKYRYTEYGEEFLGKAEEIVMKTGYGFQYIYKPYEEGDNLAE